jgi:hypothetical protein
VSSDHELESGQAIFLDSPSSTSALVYKVQMRRGGGGTAFLNTMGAESDSEGRGRTASSITVMEVAG